MGAIHCHLHHILGSFPSEMQSEACTHNFGQGFWINGVSVVCLPVSCNGRYKHEAYRVLRLHCASSRLFSEDVYGPGAFSDISY